MRHWKTVAKDVIMISLVFMGLNLAGIICGVTVFLVIYQTPYDIFMGFPLKNLKRVLKLGRRLLKHL